MLIITFWKKMPELLRRIGFFPRIDAELPPDQTVPL
jgi:hypothetical protein